MRRETRGTALIQKPVGGARLRPKFHGFHLPTRCVRVYAAGPRTHLTLETPRLSEGHMQRVGLLCVLIAALAAPLAAQVPPGAIAGTVSDRVGAVLPGAAVTVTNKATGAS